MIDEARLGYARDEKVGLRKTDRIQGGCRATLWPWLSADHENTDEEPDDSAFAYDHSVIKARTEQVEFWQTKGFQWHTRSVNVGFLQSLPSRY